MKWRKTEPVGNTLFRPYAPPGVDCSLSSLRIISKSKYMKNIKVDFPENFVRQNFFIFDPKMINSFRNYYKKY